MHKRYATKNGQELIAKVTEIFAAEGLGSRVAMHWVELVVERFGMAAAGRCSTEQWIGFANIEKKKGGK